MLLLSNSESGGRENKRSPPCADGPGCSILTDVLVPGRKEERRLSAERPKQTWERPQGTQAVPSDAQGPPGTADGLEDLSSSIPCCSATHLHLQPAHLLKIVHQNVSCRDKRACWAARNVCSGSWWQMYISVCEICLRDFHLQENGVNVLFPIPVQSMSKQPGH